MIKKFKEFVAEAVKSKAHEPAKHKLTTHDIHSSSKLPKKEGDTFKLTNRPGTYRAVTHQGNLWHGNVVYAHKLNESELNESADADAAADIADHHGVSAQSTGAGHHTVSHPAKGSGFFDHHHAHAPLKAAGWKLKEKHKTESMEGGTYTKGEHTVQVMSRHNPHQNTIVHNIKKV